MKRILLLLSLVVAMSVQAFADEATLTYSEQGYSNAQEVTSTDIKNAAGDVVATVVLDKGGNTNAPKYYNTGTGVRLYGTSTLTVNMATGLTMTKAVFTTAGGSNAFKNDASVNVGTWDSSNETWTSATGVTSFTLTNGTATSGHARIQKIVITYAAEGGPTLLPNDLSFDEEMYVDYLNATEVIEVALNNPNELPVVYSSSKEEVAIVDANGALTVLAAGTTEIKATFAGNDEYEAGTVSYTLKVVDASLAAAAGYVMLTDINDLVDGMECLIVNTEAKKAMKNAQRTKADGTKLDNMDVVDVTITDGMITTLPEGTALVKIESVENGYTFQVTNSEGAAYLSSVSNSSNYLNLSSEADVATFTVSTDGTAKVKFSKYSRGTLQYNPNNGSSLFACYGSASQKPVQIYIPVAGGEVPTVSQPDVVVTINGEVQTGSEIKLIDGAVATVELSHADGHRIYHRFVAANADESVVEAPIAANWTRYNEPIEVSADGTFGHYAEHQGIKSEAGTLSFARVQTGVENIVVDGGEARYYDLNGRVVENPAAGVYIRVVGGKASKAIIR